MNTVVHSVAKPLNGINSRWAHKMKDTIYLGFVFPLSAFSEKQSVHFLLYVCLHCTVLCVLALCIEVKK